MRIPRKADLINLQNLYKSDAKIAEALGGIPEYLIAYWRRKKGVAPHTASKFTREQIADLWERYGDDFRCGRELNISKAAFYSWRRKYGITEKPAFLKLEQLELRLDRLPAATQAAPVTVGVTRPRTATEKIRTRCRELWPQIPQAADWHIAPQGTEPDSPVVLSPGPSLQWPSEAPVFGHELPTGTPREPLWCLPDRGSILWQLIEARIVFPGQLVSGPRRLVGGFGGVGVLVLDPATGKAPVRVVRIEITRRLPANCDVEDIVLAVVAHGWRVDDPATIVEFSGVPIERLSVDRKVKLCSLTVTVGALAAICPFDDAIRRHYGRLLLGRYPQTHPDRTAIYDSEHFIEGRGVQPQVGIADESGRLRVLPPSAVSGGGVVIGPEALPYEIELAAALVEGRVLPGQKGGALLVCPASTGVYRLAHRRGWAQTFINVGGSVLDVGLSKRLGWDGVVRLAAPDGGKADRVVYCTHPPMQRMESTSPRVVFAGVRTALTHSGLIQ